MYRTASRNAQARAFNARPKETRAKPRTQLTPEEQAVKKKRSLEFRRKRAAKKRLVAWMEKERERKALQKAAIAFASPEKRKVRVQKERQAKQDLVRGDVSNASAALQLQFVEAERASIADLYYRGDISDEARRRIERELDLEDSRIRHSAESGAARAL